MIRLVIPILKKFKLKYIKSATFLLMVLSIMSNYLNYIGYDDKNILVLAFNPILNHLSMREPYRSLFFIEESRSFTILFYSCNTASSGFYGVVIDLLRRHLKFSAHY